MISELKSFIEEFNQSNPSPCWKTPGNEMRVWAEEWERNLGNRNHGLGDLNQPCPPKPGETCPACGIKWE